MVKEIDTIVALATPPGRGGIGIVRLSGPQSSEIAQSILGFQPKPRFVHFAAFRDQAKNLIDQGLVLYFKNPQSFTGEDIIEFHGHGGPITLDYLIETIIYYGARLARPGEFSERAYLNGKIDLAQAEAIADLIDSSTREGARAAMNSLQGYFSKKISELLESLINLRMYVEAAIDFPEEEIDFLSDGHVAEQLELVMQNLQQVLVQAHQGRLLREGLKIIILGKPNAGKSSLLNALSGQESAIVTEIPGTTRDLLREVIQIDGIPIYVTDTAGLRDSSDKIEQEGIRRAYQELERVDHIFLVIDSQEVQDLQQLESLCQRDYKDLFQQRKPITVILNKIDCSGLLANISQLNLEPICAVISLSAKTGEGLELVQRQLKNYIGLQHEAAGIFLARRRHLDALYRAQKALENALSQLLNYRAGELLAEDLRHAQNALSEITGEFTSEDLLTKIFSNFCIGK